MPAKWLVHPTRGKVSFEEGPALFEGDGVMPRQVIEAIIADMGEYNPHPFVRPSDVCPAMTCRRRTVFERWAPAHGVDIVVDPLKKWPMMEGEAIHLVLKTDEVEVGVPERIEVCGCPMRGRIDLAGQDIGDIKSKAPFIIYDYKAKTTKVWKPTDEVKDWLYQLSIYNILRIKAGGQPARKGYVWRVWRGVKSEQQAWQKFEFNLLTEGQMEADGTGEWMRSLYEALKLGQTDLEGALKASPMDGRKMYSDKKGYWKCNDCPLKARCETESGFSPW